MSCSVAIASSRVFSSARLPLICKTSSEATIYSSDGSPSSTSCGSSPFRSPSFRSPFQRGLSGLRAVRRNASPISLDSLTADGGAKLLKRKRPAMIDIPLTEALTFAPAAAGSRSEVEVDGDRFSVFCKRGKRRLEIEDRHRAEVNLHGDANMAFFGIFDGHGGTKAAEFVSQNIGSHIMKEVMRMEGEDDCGAAEGAVRVAYLKTDEEYLREGAVGGTCCVTAYVRNGDLIVSNAGDCRAVLSRGGVAEALTSDHKPSREDERDRIESLGGYVDCCRGVWRVQGTLAVTRGIGDVHLKQWVIAEPETRTVPIKRDCEFLILASDGLWDKVSNQEAVDIARPLCSDSAKPSPISACKKLVDLSAARGSADDISVMIVQLRHFI